MAESDPAPELHGLDPGELLARGLNTVRPSGGMHNWTPPTPEELARLLPQYHIESMIGHGGMGAVYKGFQPDLDRPVAIKLLPAELSADEQFVIRFRREARTLAKLQHPGIVSIYDFGQTSDGHLYFVMEYVDGTDLRHVLQNPGLNPEQALELTCQVCDALHSAHLQGVIHRDIKPANILITRDGRAKLADFGLARPVLAEEMGGVTGTNMVVGTPDYMAPEQHEGQSDHRTDIFALGLMLYEMLTGQRPQGAFEPASSKVSVDVRIDEVVVKALQQEPDRRYQQVSEMRTDVDHIRTVPAPVPIKPRRPVGLIATILLILLLLGIGAVYFSKRAELAPSAPKTGDSIGTPGAMVKPLPWETPPASLEEAILSSVWYCRTVRHDPVAGQNRIYDRELIFLEDGSVLYTTTGLRYDWKWKISGPHTVLIDQNFKGKVIEATFDPDLTRFTGLVRDAGPIEGVRQRPVTAQAVAVAREQPLQAVPPGTTSPSIASASAATPVPTRPVPENLETALASSIWSATTVLPSGTIYRDNRLLFLANGTVYYVGQRIRWPWSWKATGTHTVQLKTERGVKTVDLTFDDAFERYTGRYSDGGTIEGSWTGISTPETWQEIGLPQPDSASSSPVPASANL